jgi:hypothetical protein
VAQKIITKLKLTSNRTKTKEVENYMSVTQLHTTTTQVAHYKKKINKLHRTNKME